MVGILETLFRWPDGIVVGNLIASCMWGIPGIVHLSRKADRHHAEHMKALQGGVSPEEFRDRYRELENNTDLTSQQFYYHVKKLAEEYADAVRD